MEARLDSIPRAETLHYLSYHGSFLPEEILSDLARCETLMLRTARPRLVWRLFPLLSDGTLEGTDYRPAGEDIRAFLRTCGSVVLLAATLGSETESLIRRAAAARTADALILDAAGSAAIERVCDNFCADLAAALAPRFLTDRFSPGYGDMPLSDQHALFRVLDVSRRIGVSDRPQVARARGCAAGARGGHCCSRKDGRRGGAGGEQPR